MEAEDLQGSGVEADHLGERLIADRLDALEAEKVLQRALELEAEALDKPHTISTDQLERIAKEIGVDPAFVHQALGEARLKPAQRSRFAQWVLPDDLLETVTLTGLTRDEVDALIKKWMRNKEGLIEGGLLGDGVEWNIDRRWRSKVRAQSLSGGNRMSRVAGGDITHRVHSVTDTEHIVAFESKGAGPLLLARLLLAAGVGFSSLMLLGAFVSGDYVAGLFAFALGIGATIALTLGGARWWGRGIRKALRRSLAGLVGTAKPKRNRKPWFPRRKT